jgi:hypothetical protein
MISGLVSAYAVTLMFFKDTYSQLMSYCKEFMQKEPATSRVAFRQQFPHVHSNSVLHTQHVRVGTADPFISYVHTLRWLQ